MTDYRRYINALRKCAKEHENDRTSTGHIIVSDLCKDTANLLEALEQEPVLDKIRAEVMSLTDGCTHELIRNDDVLEIIDKYRSESERQGMKVLKFKKRIEIDKTIGNFHIETFH